MRKAVFIFLLTLLCACSVKLVTPTQSDVDRVSPRFPAYTLAELTAGKTLYEQKCSQCHGLKDPSKEPEDEWRKIVPDMAKKAAANPDATKFTDQDQERILRYLITMCNAPKEGK